MTLYTKNWARRKKEKEKENLKFMLLRDKDEEAIRLIGNSMWESARGK